MRHLGAFAGEDGQATVETLAMLPLVAAAAIGLCGGGLWLRESHLSEAAVASRAVEWIEAGDADSRKELAGGASSGVRLRAVGGRLEARSHRSGGSLLGISIAPEAELKWVREGR